MSRGDDARLGVVMGDRDKSLVDLIDSAARRHDGASVRRLAELAQRAGHDISHTTLNRLRQGAYVSRPTDASLRAIAYLAEVPETAAFAAAGVRAPSAEQYQLPVDAQRMSTRQRRALDELLRAFVTEQLPPAPASMGALLAARDNLAAALDRAGERSGALFEAARAVIAAIDDNTTALFSGADAEPGDGAMARNQLWPPPGDAASAVLAAT